MTTVEKAARILEIVQELKAISGDNNITVMVHNIPALNTLNPDEWKLEPMYVEANGQVVLTAKSSDGVVDLFSRENITFETEAGDAAA